MQPGIKERRKPRKEFTEEIMRQAGKNLKITRTREQQLY